MTSATTEARRPDRRQHSRSSSRHDRLRELAGTRWWTLGGPVAVVVLAAVLRLQNLGHPPTLLFDETFYVKDAWTMFNLGYEGSWPADANDAFNAGDPDGYSAEASYPAHPPLGKWLIALGIGALGVTDPASWRLGVAVAGILGVILLMLIAHRLWRRPLLTVLAGGLFAIDGHAIVLSRVGLLDNFVMLFALLGFGAVLMDRIATRHRLDARVAELRTRAQGERPMRWGPVVWWRPWLLAAGLCFGLTGAVKWSGIYFFAFFFLYVLAADALARRRHGLDFWPWGALLKQGPVNALLTGPIAVAAYLASWTGWFVTTGGYDRNWIAEGGDRWTGALAWVPDVLQNLWHWHASIYAFHNGLSASHPYSTPAILWPLLVRPTQIYYRGSEAGENGCGWSYCSEIVWSTANPILWWAANLAALYLVYRFVRFGRWREGLILTGVAAGYLPWLLYPTRTMFQFYAIAYEPYLILSLVAVIALVLDIGIGDSPGIDNLERFRQWRARRGRASSGDAVGSGATTVDPIEPVSVPYSPSAPSRGVGSAASPAAAASPATASPRSDAGGFDAVLTAGIDSADRDLDAAGRGSRWARVRRTLRRPAVRARSVVAFLVVVVLVSAFFYPMWTGMQTPFWFWTLHIWLPTWV